MAHFLYAQPCPHGDAVCSRARREPRRFLESGVCIDCQIDVSAQLAPLEVTAPMVVAGPGVPAACEECARGPCSIALMPGEACPCDTPGCGCHGPEVA